MIFASAVFRARTVMLIICGCVKVVVTARSAVIALRRIVIAKLVRIDENVKRA